MSSDAMKRFADVYESAQKLEVLRGLMVERNVLESVRRIDTQMQEFATKIKDTLDAETDSKKLQDLMKAHIYSLNYYSFILSIII